MGREKIEITPSHIIGLIAVVVSIYFLVTQIANLPIVAASIYFILACTTDTLKCKIPNILNACLLVAGIVIYTATLGVSGLLLSLYGLGLGLILLLLPYIMGGIGAGDVKALGALGALIGPYDLLHVFIYMGLYGGVLALLHYCFNTNIKDNLREAWFSVCASVLTREVNYIVPHKPGPRKASMRFPYSAAIALGYYSFVYWGGLL
ncbi:prepilin peptidase [Deltaproteobacteria bacterium IMCC39524]|nr:prepilin peptidase [Deltaproteobacteria bacterium IMCC39524]